MIHWPPSLAVTVSALVVALSGERSFHQMGIYDLEKSRSSVRTRHATSFFVVYDQLWRHVFDDVLIDDASDYGRGSLERRESRGAFFRDDYPEIDNENWLKNIIYRQVDGELVLETVPVDLKYCAPETERAASRTK